MNKIKTKIEKVEQVIQELEDWSPKKKTSKVLLDFFGVEINSEASRNAKLNLFYMVLETLKLDPSNNFHYLSGILHNEGINLKSGNLLLLSPLGSGKTTFIKEFCENNNLVLTLVPYNKEKYKGSVMTYEEFINEFNKGKLFLDKFETIICDEVQAIVAKSDCESKTSPARDYLLSKHEGKCFIYFSSSEDSNFKFKLENFGHIKIIDFIHTEKIKIKQYFPEAEYKFYNLTQLRLHFSTKKFPFKYYGFSILALSKTKYEQDKIFSIAKEEGFNPINLASKENEKIKDLFLKIGEIPKGYNCIIIDNLDDDWNLSHEDIRFVIINSPCHMDRIRMLEGLNDEVGVIPYITDDKY